MSLTDASGRPGCGLHARSTRPGGSLHARSTRPGGGLHERFGQAQPRLRPGPRAGALQPCGLRRASRPASPSGTGGLGSASGCAARLRGRRPPALAPGAGQISGCPRCFASALSLIDVEPDRSTDPAERSQPQRPALPSCRPPTKHRRTTRAQSSPWSQGRRPSPPKATARRAAGRTPRPRPQRGRWPYRRMSRPKGDLSA